MSLCTPDMVIIWKVNVKQQKSISINELFGFEKGKESPSVVLF